MGLSLDQMKELIRKPYPGPSWQSTVDKMPTNQIVAIYYNLKKRGVLDKKKKKRKEAQDDPHWQQMTLWDLDWALNHNERTM